MPKRKSSSIPTCDPSRVPGAFAARLPAKLAPQLATLAADVPQRGEWLYEVKFDGYRLLARFDGGRPRLITRGGHDWSLRMPQLVAALQGLGIDSGWIDGEIVVLNGQGLPDFGALQNAFDRRSGAKDVVYFVFDILFHDGFDLRNATQRDRKAHLQDVMKAADGTVVRFSESFDASPHDLLESACRTGLEGLIGKRADAKYFSTRSSAWIKLKCKHRQEFVVCGYTVRSDNAEQVGSLLLGVHDDGVLVPVGSVGTGWNGKEAAALLNKLRPLAQLKVPYGVPAAKPGRWSRRKPGSEVWVQPRLVAEVEFQEWTSEGQVRHASFVGLRTDKSPRRITRETARHVSGAAKAA